MRIEKGGVIERLKTVEIEGVIETVIGNLRRGIETEGGVEIERRTGIEIEMGIETDIEIKDDEAILLLKCFVKKNLVKKKIKIFNFFVFIVFFTEQSALINNLLKNYHIESLWIMMEVIRGLSLLYVQIY